MVAPPAAAAQPDPAGRYRFMQRYSSGFEHHRGYGVDGPFARLDCVEQDSFDSHWMRPTGKWRRLHAKLTLAEALRMIETDEMLHPH